MPRQLRPCGTVAAYRRGCRCEECRSANAVSHKAYEEGYRDRTGASLTQKYRPRQTVTSGRCSECGIGIHQGNTCKPCWRMRYEQARRAAVRRRRAEARLAKAIGGTSSNARWPWVSGTCLHCGDQFTRRGGVSPYCSKLCNKRDRPSGSWISRSARLALYERDGWVCQLCHGPVDPDLHYLDDWAASLDHIECQAWALIPDHSPGNLRLAHRWCNSVRGDETHYTTTDLSA